MNLNYIQRHSGCPVSHRALDLALVEGRPLNLGRQCSKMSGHCSIDNIAYETGLETDDVTSLTCIQIWADKVCYAGDEAPAKEGHLNGRVMLFCVVVQVSNYFLFL